MAEKYYSSDESPLSLNTQELLAIINKFLKEYADQVKYVNNRRTIYEITRSYIGGGVVNNKSIEGLHSRIDNKVSESYDFAKLTGLAFVPEYEKLGIPTSGKYKGPSFQIQNLRLVNRVGPDGNQVNQVIFSVYQRSGVVFENGEFKGHYSPDKIDKKGKTALRTEKTDKDIDRKRFEFRGGCTLIFDLDKMQLKYVVAKPIINVGELDIEGRVVINRERLEAQYDFQYGNEDSGANEFSLYFGDGAHKISEPFAFLHQH